MSEIDPDVFALFGGPVSEEPAAIIPPDAPPNDPTIAPPAKKRGPKPKAKSVEVLIMPSCDACGVDMNPENASKLPDGSWKHIGCKPQPKAIPQAEVIVPPIVTPATGIVVQHVVPTAVRVQEIAPVIAPERATIAPPLDPSLVKIKAVLRELFKGILVSLE